MSQLAQFVSDLTHARIHALSAKSMMLLEPEEKSLVRHVARSLGRMQNPEADPRMYISDLQEHKDRLVSHMRSLAQLQRQSDMETPEHDVRDTRGEFLFDQINRLNGLLDQLGAMPEMDTQSMGQMPPAEGPLELPE